MENANNTVRTDHTPKKLRHDIFNNKIEGAVITSSKNDENKKRVAAKEKKHAATLIVGKDISLTKVPEYLSLDLVGRFCSKTVDKATLCRWMEEKWSPLLRQLPMFHVMSR